MSQYTLGAPSTPRLNFNLGGISCNGCGRFIEYRPCKSNSNGNLGRPVAVVSMKSYTLYILAAINGFQSANS